MFEPDLSPAKVKALVDACHSLAAHFAAEACRIIAEADDDHDLLPYLDSLPVKIVRDFDDAIRVITHPDDFADEGGNEQRAKYEAAMAEMRTASTPPRTGIGPCRRRNDNA